MCKHIYNPDQTYLEGTPFTYFIGWSKLNKFYYGVRYRKNCHPDDLWTKYFTSSTYVEEFRKLNGEPDIIKVDFVYDTTKEARFSEHQFLKENNCVRDSKWLNLGNGGEDFCSPDHFSEIHKERKSKAMKGRVTINNGFKEKLIKPDLLQDFLENGWVLGQLPKSKKTIQKITNSMLGRVTINNGLKEKKVKKEDLQSYLDLKWVDGGLPKTETFKDKCSLRMQGNKNSLGLEHSTEFKENQSIRMQGNKLNSGKIWINNGITNKILKPEDAEIYYQQGYVSGMIQKRKI